MSMRAMRDELREAKENRGAAIGLAVFTPHARPDRGRAVQPWSATTSTASSTRTPRSPPRSRRPSGWHGCWPSPRWPSTRWRWTPAAIAAALTAIREQLELVRTLKAQLTSISTATKAVWTGLDTMRSNILARVTEAETEIRAATDARARRPSGPYGSGAVRTGRLRDPDQGAVGAGCHGGGHLGRARRRGSRSLRAPPKPVHGVPMRRRLAAFAARHAHRPPRGRSGERGGTEPDARAPDPDAEHPARPQRRAQPRADPPSRRRRRPSAAPTPIRRRRSTPAPVDRRPGSR